MSLRQARGEQTPQPLGRYSRSVGRSLDRERLINAARRARGVPRHALIAALIGRRRADFPNASFYLPLDYPTSSCNSPRWGHGRPNHPFIEPLLATHADSYRDVLALLPQYGEELAAIDRAPRLDSEPYWDNGFWATSGLDAAAIYCLLRSRQPRRYLELGSGQSTKFAARAKRDGGLDTKIISIDPEPREDIDAICDLALRRPVESAPLSYFEQLEPGDVVFLDGSHRLFMNNDVSTFYLDVLPRLVPGVLVGVHDIYLPEDYGPDAVDQYYTEAYMLAAMLLAGPDRIRPVLASHWVCLRPDLSKLLDETWASIGLGGISAYGSAFWFEPNLQAPGPSRESGRPVETA